ncbi:MAG: hypothetical protein PHC66_03220 [Candidatus Nanoarchaeia archaeon]|nr:hypothetical protein [Candidatus Nanoarchaeia archaeon]MDD5239445.1 hypothetical protein [Candidatus Nanoarchaeia archaeon]
MPIGEDIPMLIPISILLTVVVLFVFSMFISITSQNELIRMSQLSMDTMDYVANIKFSDGFGNLDYDKFGTYFLGICKDVDRFNITANYKVNITVYDSTSNRIWCWHNTDEEAYKNSIVNTLPFIIKHDNETHFGQVTVVVGK